MDTVTIRFAGDSGDGMQLTGDRFTSVTAQLGNDLATLPDFPAEIRAPAGSLPGVSGFQLHFADHDILTPGDSPDVLVAMNPAALRTNIDDLRPGGTLVVNSDAFTRGNLKKAHYEANPLEDDSLAELPGVPGPDHDADGRGARGPPAVVEGQAAREEHVRAGPHVASCTRGRSSRPSAGSSEKFAPQPRDRQGQHHRAAGRLGVRRDDRDVRPRLRGRAGVAARRAATARSPATRRWPSA